jgi:phage terminase large subunit
VEKRIELDYAPRPQFRAYHERTQRWAVIVAHRRFGKTVGAINDLIKRALQCQLPNPRYAYIAPYFVQAKDIAWSYLKHFCAPLLPYSASPNESELRVMLPNGASIRLYGADNADRMRGIYLDGALLDEPADMAPRVWGEIIRPTLSDRKGWATFIGTPKGHNSFYDIWQRAQGNGEWYSLLLKASQTNVLAQEELDAARRDLSEDQYAQEYECSFEAAIHGAVLGRWMTAAHDDGRIGDVAYDHDGRAVVISSDIGYHDTAAWWFWQPRVGGFALVDYDEDNGLDATEWAHRLAKRCKDNGYKLGQVCLPHDAKAKTFAARETAQEQFWKVFGHAMVRVVPQTSKADRINAARRVMPRCWFDATRCADGIEALKQWRFKWDEDRKEFSKEPDHDWASHPGDAFSYGAQVLEEVVLPKVEQRKPITDYRFGVNMTFDELRASVRKRRAQEAA